MTKLLDHLTAKPTGKLAPAPLPYILNIDERYMDNKPVHMGIEYIISVEVGCHVIAKYDESIADKKRDVRHLLAREIYGDILKDVDELARALYESRMLEPEVNDKLNKLTEKLQGY